MMPFAQLIIAAGLLSAVVGSPFDDGKYSPKKYKFIDDGKYYRPLDEGKYVPGDEGKYTYIYRNQLYPAFPYVHQEGRQGGFGGEGGFGGDGPNGPDGPDQRDESKRIQYIGRKIYAERFPYVHNVIEALVDKYVSNDLLFGENPEGSSNHYNKIYADKETAAKCQYLSHKEEKSDFATQYPPRLDHKGDENLGSYYSFKGTKILSNVENSLNNKIKLEYEVYVRIIDEETA